MPDDGAVVIGEVGALAPTEALAPVQRARQPAVGLGGQYDPARARRPATPLRAWRRSRRTSSAEASRRARAPGRPPPSSRSSAGAVGGSGSRGPVPRRRWPAAGASPTARRSARARARLRGSTSASPSTPTTRIPALTSGSSSGGTLAPGSRMPLVVVDETAARGARPQPGGSAAAVALHRDHVEGTPEAPVDGRGQAGVQRVVAAAGELPDRSRRAVGGEVAQRDDVAAVAYSVQAQAMPSPTTARVGSQTLPESSSLTRTVGSQPLPFQRRAKTPNRSSTRPCQHTCRPPSPDATTSWLKDGPWVSLTGCGSAPRTVDEAAGPHSDLGLDGPAEDQPRNAVRGDGRGRPEQVLWRPDHDGGGVRRGRRPRRPAGRRGPPAIPATRRAGGRPRAATVGRDALRLRGRTRAVPRSDRPAVARCRAPRRPW